MSTEILVKAFFSKNSEESHTIYTSTIEKAVSECRGEYPEFDYVLEVERDDTGQVVAVCNVTYDFVDAWIKSESRRLFNLWNDGKGEGATLANYLDHNLRGPEFRRASIRSGFNKQVTL